MKGVSGVSPALGRGRLRPSEALQRHLEKLAAYFEQRGVSAYLVGGWVRDALLNRPSQDLDIAISQNPLALGRQLAAHLGGTFVPLDEINRVGRVLLRPPGEAEPNEPWTFDFSPIRGDIANDLAQRDFTIDALAIELGELLAQKEDAAIIDPWSGQEDLEQRLVRASREEAFAEDPLRLLRGVRLAAELDFALDPATQEMIRRHCGLATAAAGERIRDEIASMLETPRGAQALRLMDNLGLLGRLIPEMENTRGVSQPKEHNWDVLEHSLATVAAAEALVHPDAPREDWIPRRALALLAWSPQLTKHFEEKVGHGHSRKVTLKLAALLHDIRKPQTKTVDSTGRTHFFGHPLQGAEVAANIMERFRFSANESRMVASMVEHHLRPGQLASQGLPTARAIYRYFRDTGEVGIDTLFLHAADYLAMRGPALALSERYEQLMIVGEMLNMHSTPVVDRRRVRLLTGYDVMRVMNIKAGPAVGKLLEKVEEAQAIGEIKTKKEAIELLRRISSYY